MTWQWWTYARFHLVLVVPPLLALAWLLPAGAWTANHGLAVALTFAAIYVFTTPWDNYAVACRTWDFPPRRYAFRIGYLPIEEYLFFGLQAALVILVQAHWAHWAPAAPRWWQPDLGHPALGAALLLFLAGWGAYGWSQRRRFTKAHRGHYAWHLLYWFAPVFACQWLIGFPILLPAWPLVVGPAVIVGTYLVALDLLAIRAGLWFFDEAQITGWKWRGIVPWEEIAFFYLTSLAVTQSMLLWL